MSALRLRAMADAAQCGALPADLQKYARIAKVNVQTCNKAAPPSALLDAREDDDESATREQSGQRLEYFDDDDDEDNDEDW